jgi:FAD-dependent urate hydroxylase
VADINPGRGVHRKIQQIAAKHGKTPSRCHANVIRMTKTPAIVIGAGIAGPGMAIALQRAGFDAVVYEASDAPRDDTGVFLNLAPNGIAVLRALGVEDAIRGLGFQNDQLIFHNEAGRVLASVPVGGVTLMRGALSRALREAAAGLGVRFVFGKQLEHVTVDGDLVAAHFSDGTTATGPCLIGADGIHSRTRTAVFADAPTPASTGIVNVGGIARTNLTPTGRAMHMVFGRQGFFGYAVRPSGETYWFANYAQRREPAAFEITNNADEFRPRLLAIHRDDPPEINAILESASDRIGAYAIHDIARLPNWHRAHVCLIGDAAHAIGPHVGQGAALALEDAFVVAKCLRDVSTPAAAFAMFEQLRRRRVDPIVTASRRTGRQKTPTGWLGRKIRDLLLPVFLRQGAKAADELYRYRLDWDQGGRVDSAAGRST